MQRVNPQADTITALSWIGIVTLGFAWPFALVWAYWKSADQKTRELSERVRKLIISHLFCSLRSSYS